MTDRGLARFTSGRTRAAPDPASAATRGGPTSEPSEIAEPLARILRARTPPTPGESCEMCAQPVSDDHRHVVDLERRGLLCVCQGCSLLFMGTEPGQTRYRTVPDRFLRVEPFVMPQPAWASLQIPVGMAFVVRNTQLERTVAFYPSPGGATESELPLDSWNEVLTANPGLEQVDADVEAILFRTGADTHQCFVVPVDRCYELVGVLRLHWRGFDGGAEVRAHLDAFFADVRRLATRAVTEVVRPHSGPLTRPRRSPAATGNASEVGAEEVGDA